MAFSDCPGRNETTTATIAEGCRGSEGVEWITTMDYYDFRLCDPPFDVIRYSPRYVEDLTLASCSAIRSEQVDGVTLHPWLPHVTAMHPWLPHAPAHAPAPHPELPMQPGDDGARSPGNKAVLAMHHKNCFFVEAFKNI